MGRNPRLVVLPDFPDKFFFMTYACMHLRYDHVRVPYVPVPYGILFFKYLVPPYNYPTDKLAAHNRRSDDFGIIYRLSVVISNIERYEQWREMASCQQPKLVRVLVRSAV